MQKILVLSGKKQSGKTSACNYIHGYVLREVGVFKDFGVHPDNGDLVVPTMQRTAGGTIEETKGFFSFGEDRVLTEPYYVEFAQKQIWQYIKRYSFGDALKRNIINLYGVSVDQCYGTNDQKDTETAITWKDITKVMGLGKTRKIMKSMGLPHSVNRSGDKEDPINRYLTARQLMQVYGTDICRTIDPECWFRCTMNNVLGEKVPIAVIEDARFPNEIDGVDSLANAYDIDVKTIRCERDLFGDTHHSETALDDYENFDLRIPHECELDEKHELILAALREWGWV